MPEALDVRLAHECFPQPADRGEQVWRYLSLPKFVSLLNTSQLHLARLDILDDPHEGSITAAGADARRDMFTSLGVSGQAMAMMPEINRAKRRAFYVNCWALCAYESEALWRLYTSQGEGVAIQTTYESLIDVIRPDDELYLGKITYLDYETQMFDEGNIFRSVMHKRRSFSHEQEVRLVKLQHEYFGDGSTVGPPVLPVSVNLDSLVQAIYVSPYAPSWFRDVVTAVVERFAPTLGNRIHWSQMKSAPNY